MDDYSPTPRGTPQPAQIADGEKPDTLVEMFKTVIYAVLLALVIRSVAFEPFNIPSGSMLPNLLVGDYIFVSKYSYGYSRYSFPFAAAPIQTRWWISGDAGAPARGDVVVFRLPTNTDIDYIKRVVGLPGDTVQLLSGRLYINGEKVERKYLGTYQAEGADGQEQTLKEYIEYLPGGVEHRILEVSDWEERDNTPVYKVPAGHYFMMGDNRDNSADSRVMGQVGFVPYANLLGPARWRFFSGTENFAFLKPWTWYSGVRWSRLFGVVK